MSMASFGSCSLRRQDCPGSKGIRHVRVESFAVQQLQATSVAECFHIADETADVISLQGSLRSVNAFAGSAQVSLRTGKELRELGPWNTVLKRFLEWTRLEIRDDILLMLSLKTDHDALIIDTTFIKVHQQGHFRQTNGRKRAGLTSNIHAVVDASGNSLRIFLSAVNVNDTIPAGELLVGLSGASFLHAKPLTAMLYWSRQGSRIWKWSSLLENAGAISASMTPICTRSGT